MHKVPAWKPILLAAVVALSIWSLIPIDKKLKPGLDLVGGTTLVYEVQIGEDVLDPRGVLEDTIAVLRERVDPAGVRNLIWRVQGANRIEIQMPLAPAQTDRLRRAYLEAREALIRGNLPPRQLDAALRAPEPQRGELLDRLAAGSASTRAQLGELAAVYDAMTQARQPYEDVQRQLREAEAALQAAQDAPEDEQRQLRAQVDELKQEVQTLARAFLEARRQYEAALERVLANNIDTGRLESVLAMYVPPAGSAKARQTYDNALKSLKEAYPGRAEEIQKVADAYAAYAAVKGPLDDPNDLIAMLRGSGVLEFRIAAPATLPDAGEYLQQLQERGPRAGPDRPWRWFAIDNPERFAGDPADFKLLTEDPARFFARRGMVGAEYGGSYYVLLGNRKDTSIRREDGDWALLQVTRGRDDLGFSAIDFTLNSVGGQLMSALTGAHINQPMAIVLDGRVISAPTINSRIADRGIITGGAGGFSQREMDYMIRTLGAGSLQAQLSEDPVSVKTTGPQLGQDNLRRGLRAAMISVALVTVFMLGYYYLLGLIANIALLLNVLLVLSVMALLEATFTLPGIAGIVLTIGMAVDANVLVFERIREEQERGAEPTAAVRLGFEKALSTIIDANITTLITCLVLGYTATAEVKGFAVTLGIGICATLFATLFAGRVLIDLYLQTARPRKLGMLPLSVPAVRRLLSPNVNWIRLRHVFFTISATLITLGVVFIYIRGSDIFDLEFRSGTQVSFELKAGRTMTLEAVRARLDEASRQMNMPSLSRDRAKVVTVGAATAAGEASAFNVQVVGDADAQQISEAIKQTFADLIEAQAPIDFTAMDREVTSGQAPPIHIVRQANLGENIGRAAEADVSEYLGGVAIVLDDLQPPATVADLTQRIRRMREQPGEFEGLGFRPFTVIGLDLAAQQGPPGSEPLYRSAVVVSRDAVTDYAQDPDTFGEPGGLADTEWRLVRAALQRDTSLASVTSFSSQVSDTMRQQAIAAIVLSLLAVVVYIWFRFGSFRYGVAAIAALVHDTTVALGLVALCGFVQENQTWAQWLLIAPFRIDLAMVAALLTLIGYSLNDTIIVFDRIRENRGRLAVASAAIINDSINQTISRTAITSGTTLIALIVLYFVGGPGVHGFAFAMTIGVLVGTYSSIAVAAPLLILLRKGGFQEIRQA